MTCPEGPHPCGLAREVGLFGIFHCASEATIEATSESDARRIATGLYPQAAFVLTPLSAVYERPAEDTPDMVVMAVLIPDRDVAQPTRSRWTHKLVAHVFGFVSGPTCIPFSRAVWPDARGLT